MEQKTRDERFNRQLQLLAPITVPAIAVTEFDLAIAARNQAMV
jgi:hypothetical protein